ncbi:MAG: hypothetical protein ACR2G5_17075 [Pyrinomonadaceae bacterium]
MAKKKRAKKKHSVKAHLHVLELTRAGSSLDLAIYADQEKIGTLVIGSGSLSWYGGKRKIRKRISWTRFADMMDELAYGR